MVPFHRKDWEFNRLSNDARYQRLHSRAIKHAVVSSVQHLETLSYVVYTWLGGGSSKDFDRLTGEREA